jgi:hypothetical protein
MSPEPGSALYFAGSRKVVSPPPTQKYMGGDMSWTRGYITAGLYQAKNKFGPRASETPSPFRVTFHLCSGKMLGACLEDAWSIC